MVLMMIVQLMFQLALLLIVWLMILLQVVQLPSRCPVVGPLVDVDGSPVDCQINDLAVDSSVVDPSVSVLLLVFQ